jgi:hypothetical protein
MWSVRTALENFPIIHCIFFLNKVIFALVILRNLTILILLPLTLYLVLRTLGIGFMQIKIASFSTRARNKVVYLSCLSAVKTELLLFKQVFLGT